MTRTLRRLTVAATCALAVVAAVLAMRGVGVYVVRTGSMLPTYHPGDAIIDGPAPAHIQPGQVVTFASASGPDTVVTHRVQGVAGGIVHTKGDANRTVDPWTVPISSVRGEPVLTLPFGGYVLVYLRQPAGVASLLTLLLAIMLAWRIYFPVAGRHTATPGTAGHVLVRRTG